MTDLPADTLSMLTLVKAGGELEISLARQVMPQPRDHDVLVKVLATPINPSDLGLLVGAADVSTARASVRDGLPVLTADIPPAGMRAMAARVGEALPVGNEGCGLVVQAGASAEAQALLGKTVALLGGGLYAQYRCVPAMMCMPLPDGVDPADGASCFVNPLTAMAFAETMRREGHSAIVHTAAASNLGQMLVKICAKDGIPLVNIVRSEAQAALLKEIGARYVINSSAESFVDDLVAAIGETGATLGFDAIGGGKLASQILSAMEVVAAKKLTAYSRYGSDTFKRIYIYGALDTGPTVLNRTFGFTWSVAGFLLMPFMAKVGPEVLGRMRQRVVDELTTTFKSHYSHQVSLTELLDPAVLTACNAKRTGEKYLIRP